MRRAVIFSDLHLANFEPFSRIDPETGLNSRLMDGIRILRQIRDYCVKHKIKHVFFTGDMFDSSKRAYPDVLKIWARTMIDFAQNEIQFYCLPGNHDDYAQDGIITALSPFEFLPAFFLMDGVKQIVMDGMGINLISCPKRKDLDQQKEDLEKAGELVIPKMTNVLMGHFFVKEIMEAQGVTYDSGVVTHKDLPKGCDLYALGDYHVHCWLPKLKLLSVGAPNHHVFASFQRPQGGFLDFDFDKMTFKRIETNAPMFMTIENGETFPDGHDPKNFYRVFVESKQQEDAIRAKLSDDWNVIFPSKKDVNGNNGEEETRLDVRIDTSPEEVIRRYVSYLGMDQRFLDKGLELLL